MSLLRISIGIIYIWFGALKYFPNLSPADHLAKDTIHIITFGLISDSLSIILLAIWETVLGFLLIAGIWKRVAFYFLLLHLICTFVPLFCLSDISFTKIPYAFTLVGQYIVKNIIIICSALVLNTHPNGLQVSKAGWFLSSFNIRNREIINLFDHIIKLSILPHWSRHFHQNIIKFQNFRCLAFIPMPGICNISKWSDTLEATSHVYLGR